MERRKPGRPSKGDRKLASFRLPTRLIAALKPHAAKRGMTVTDLVGEVLSNEVGMPYQSQEGLPLHKAAS